MNEMHNTILALEHALKIYIVCFLLLIYPPPSILHPTHQNNFLLYQIKIWRALGRNDEKQFYYTPWQWSTTIRSFEPFMPLPGDLPSIQLFGHHREGPFEKTPSHQWNIYSSSGIEIAVPLLRIYSIRRMCFLFSQLSLGRDHRGRTVSTYVSARFPPGSQLLLQVEVSGCKSAQ